MKCRLTFWLLAVLLGTMFFSNACADPNQYVFAVVGDIQPPGDGAYKQVTKDIIAQIAASPAKFVVFAGDLVSGTNPQRWIEFDELTKPLRDAGKTMYAILGNNDVESAAMIAGFTERFGARYQVVQQPGVSLILLDSEAKTDGYRDWDLGDEQTTWLQTRPWTENVEIGKRPLLFFFTHRPPYRSEIMKMDPGNKYGQDKSELAQMLVKFGADAVFSGHEHLYEKRETDTCTFYITGGGGGNLLPVGYYHYLLVTVSPGKPSFKVKDIKVKSDEPRRNPFQR